MARYIDADKLHIKMEDLYEHHIEMRNYSADGAVADCLDLLDNTPTADVEEVKHAEWVEDGYYDEPCVCSNCGAEAQYVSKFNETFDYDWEENLQPTGYEEIREYIRTPYCPNCGAKMDGKDNNVPTK